MSLNPNDGPDLEDPAGECFEQAEPAPRRAPRPVSDPAAQYHPEPRTNHAPAPEVPAHEEWKPKDAVGQDATLPPIESSAGIEDEEIEEAPELIEGLLREGEFMIFAADAKMGKTWLAIELAHAVTCGGHWCGLRVMSTGAVVYLNYELGKATFKVRLKAVCKQRGVYPDNIYTVNMRGSDCDIPTLAGHIAATCSDYGVKLIVIDSLYNTYGARSENDNTDMAALMKEIIAAALKTKASILALHHYSKSSHMAASDSARASGANALHRAPDNLTTATRLTEKEVRELGLPVDHFHARVSPSLRSFRDMPSFIISKPMGDWRYTRAAIDLAEAKKAAAAKRADDKSGPAQVVDTAALCSWLGDSKLSPGEFDRTAATYFEVSEKTIKRRRYDAIRDGSLTKEKDGTIRATFRKRTEAGPAIFLPLEDGSLTIEG